MEIQSRPLCDRQSPLEPGPKRRLEVRGAPATATRDGSLEVYTADTAISLVGDDPALLRRAADQLRPVPMAHLPPRGGALEDLPELDRQPRFGDLTRPGRDQLRKPRGCRFKRP